MNWAQDEINEEQSSKEPAMDFEHVNEPNAEQEIEEEMFHHQKSELQTEIEPKQSSLFDTDIEEKTDESKEDIFLREKVEEIEDKDSEESFDLKAEESIDLKAEESFENKHEDSFVEEEMLVEASSNLKTSSQPPVFSEIDDSPIQEQKIDSKSCLEIEDQFEEQLDDEDLLEVAEQAEEYFQKTEADLANQDDPESLEERIEKMSRENDDEFERFLLGSKEPKPSEKKEELFESDLLKEFEEPQTFPRKESEVSRDSLSDLEALSPVGTTFAARKLEKVFDPNETVEENSSFEEEFGKDVAKPEVEFETFVKSDPKEIFTSNSDFNQFEAKISEDSTDFDSYSQYEQKMSNNPLEQKTLNDPFEVKTSADSFEQKPSYDPFEVKTSVDLFEQKPSEDLFETKTSVDSLAQKPSVDLFETKTENNPVELKASNDLFEAKTSNDPFEISSKPDSTKIDSPTSADSFTSSEQVRFAEKFSKNISEDQLDAGAGDSFQSEKLFDLSSDEKDENASSSFQTSEPELEVQLSSNVVCRKSDSVEDEDKLSFLLEDAQRDGSDDDADEEEEDEDFSKDHPSLEDEGDPWRAPRRQPLDSAGESLSHPVSTYNMIRQCNT